MTKLENFYDHKGDLPNKFIAIYSDGSGCGLFVKRGRLYYHADMVDAERRVDKDWFVVAGYLWFIALPDDFKVWGEDAPAYEFYGGEDEKTTTI